MAGTTVFQQTLTHKYNYPRDNKPRKVNANMKARTLLLLVVLGVIIVFAALNWAAFTATTTLSLGLTTIEAPLGLIMLGLLIFLTALFLIFVVYLQTSVLVEARRHARELQAHRGLADQAEASRFTELRNFLETELQRIEQRDAASHSAVLQRMEQSENTLAAYIGELEDRLERGNRGLSIDRPAHE
jgi:uncharacterized integral membrane protein